MKVDLSLQSGEHLQDTLRKEKMVQSKIDSLSAFVLFLSHKIKLCPYVCKYIEKGLEGNGSCWKQYLPLGGDGAKTGGGYLLGGGCLED